MDQLYKQIVQFQGRCNDYIDDPSAHVSKTLQQEVQRLEDEAQVGKNPASLEGRVKSIIRLLEDAGENEAMSQGHVNQLIDQCESFREHLQKLR